MSARDTDIATFLQSAGWGAASRAALAGDASARRYERLSDPETGTRAVLMDAPSEQGEDVRPFVKTARHLISLGLSAPEILAEDAATGLLLLEDLGDDLFARVCASDPAMEQTCYAAAVDMLVHLHRQPPMSGLAPYDLAAYLRETRLLTDWYLPTATGHPVAPDLAGEYAALVAEACQNLHGDQSVTVLRDYHAENLIWLSKRRGHARVGLLDFQDALLGHPAYDLVSLLEDARRDTSEALQQAMVARYCQEAAVNRRDFQRAYATLGAQRNLKIIGIFARLCLRDGKARYLELIPRVWGHLKRDLAHPDLKDLRHFVETHIPPPSTATLARLKGARP